MTSIHTKSEQVNQGVEFKGIVSSAEELLSKSCSDWVAEEHELITSGGVVAKNHKAIVRSDTNDVVGIVGKDYGVVQNVEAFSMFDIIAREKGANFARVKTFDNGASMVARMELPVRPEDYIRMKDDRVKRVIDLTNSFDGSTGFVGDLGLEVLACSNGLRRKARESRFMLRHTKNIKDRYSQAFEVFGIAEVYFDELINRSKSLAKKIFTKQDMKKFVEALFPINPKKEDFSTRALNNQSAVMALFFEGMGNVGRSAFDAYNALTEWLDHKRFKDADKANKANHFGTGRKMRETAFQYLERV